MDGWFGAFERCLRETMAFCSVVRSRLGATIPTVNLGGGHAVAYTGGDGGRPPVLGVGDSLTRTLVRRETVQALLCRAA